MTKFPVADLPFCQKHVTFVEHKLRLGYQSKPHGSHASVMPTVRPAYTRTVMAARSYTLFINA